MVEVFKTNVKDRDLADMLIEQIHHAFGDYRANFDLDDCDKILRVQSLSGEVQSTLLLEILERYGFQGEILPDDVPFVEQLFQLS